jgi:hypothetical protein
MKVIIALLLVLSICSASEVIISTTSWCMHQTGECFDFSHTVPRYYGAKLIPVQEGIKIIITDNPYKYCGEGPYDYGCALLYNDTAVVKQISDNGTLNSIDHEILHLWLWKTEKNHWHSSFPKYNISITAMEG